MSEPTSNPAPKLAPNPARIIVPVADLLRAPGGQRDRQVLFGETMQILATNDGWSHIKAEKDGYCGYLSNQALGPALSATHWISAASTHAYARPDLKSPNLLALSFASQITVTSWTDGYARTEAGYIPAVHISPIGTHMQDPLTVAQLFIGTPYLWGGNSRSGIDCSGLVQAAYSACGHPCPGDSGPQQQAFGPPLPAGTAPRRNDLLFFPGHVAIVADGDTLLHANAFHMAVSFEPLDQALARIEAQGDGKVISHVRPQLK